MSSRLFGTNGVRGIVNSDLNVQIAIDLGKAISTVAPGVHAICTDSRISGDMLKFAVSAGLMSAGSCVIDLGILPTPALQYYVKIKQLSGGVAITASHNPPEFNGIKCIAADGTEIPREDEEKIESIYYNRSFKMSAWNHVGSLTCQSDALRLYLESVKNKIDVEAIKSASLCAVVDCANGAGSLTTPLFLESLGIRVITLNCSLLGTFPGRPSEPTEENLSSLIALVKETSADIGIAHDGDADRTIFIDERGNFVHGDRSLALIAKHIVSEKGSGLVVTPVSTSRCVEEAVSSVGGHVKYTKVGAPVVAREMMRLGAVFGGEENGGLIFPEHQYCRDGLMTVAKMLEIIVKEGHPSQLLSYIPKYYQIKGKIGCSNEKKMMIMAKLLKYAEGMHIDTTDGMKIFLEDGWILIRPSGTEPILRVMVEGKTKATATKYYEEYTTLLKDIISDLQS
ncbi:MAG: phosphoglucosamine mutase [Methanomassiliicoccales archaeon]